MKNGWTDDTVYHPNSGMDALRKADFPLHRAPALWSLGLLLPQTVWFPNEVEWGTTVACSFRGQDSRRGEQCTELFTVAVTEA